MFTKMPFLTLDIFEYNYSMVLDLKNARSSLFSEVIGKYDLPTARHRFWKVLQMPLEHKGMSEEYECSRPNKNTHTKYMDA